MTSPPPSQPTITPASLFSLAIYNPNLGNTDETVNDQIVFYTSRIPQTPNERLRQIGLAQGVVEFARGFTKSENLSNIETEKSRIVLKELEEGWWALAYIDYTRITTGDITEHSLREVSQPQLLLAQIITAYQQYRFHYGTFSANLETLGREEFSRRLEKYWLRWAWGWEVTPNGNPAIDVWNATKVAQPRLGATVREVLEGTIAHERAVDGGGLVDMVVSRFGKVEEPEHGKDGGSSALASQLELPRASSGLGLWPWPSSSGSSPASSSRNPSPARPPSLIPLAPSRPDRVPKEITASDGCIFTGTGRLDPQSVRDISVWASNIYRYGEDRSTTKTKSKGKRPRHNRLSSSASALNNANGSSSTEASPSQRGRAGSTEPSPLAVDASPSPTKSTNKPRPQSLIGPHKTPSETRERSISVAAQPNKPPPLKVTPSSTANTFTTTNEKLLNILTFGWAGAGASKGKDQNAQNPVITETSVESHSQPSSPMFSRGSGDKKRRKSGPRFLYGYTGNLDDDDDGDEAEVGLGIDGVGGAEALSRKIRQKSVWLYENEGALDTTGQGAIGNGNGIPPERANNTDGAMPNPSKLKPKEFRIVVYLDPPLIFIFIFRPSTPRLDSPTFYRSLHLRLHPLRNSLLPSQTSTPSKGPRSRPSTSSKPIVYDLLFDPKTLTVSSSLPNIPSFTPYPTDTYTPIPLPPPWSRADAIHVHNQVLNIFADGDREKERKSRTARGWWLAWNRLGMGGKEAILVWRGGEAGVGKNGVLGQRDLGGDIAGGGGSSGGGGGILDTKRYFEGLLRGRG